MHLDLAAAYIYLTSVRAGRSHRRPKGTADSVTTIRLPWASGHGWLWFTVRPASGPLPGWLPGQWHGISHGPSGFWVGWSCFASVEPPMIIFGLGARQTVLWSRLPM